ncbi:MAG: serine/threonine-protein kinase [Dehalococcoidia bacterium]|nr:serine/threonine-protein kinase [Dehalococcoidia bacterium]
MSPSDIIEQRYRLVRVIGSGGMAEVWLAEDLRLDRNVAVKVLTETVNDAEAGELAESIQQEARTVARLQHPNIVTVYDAGVVENRHYLVMEYVEGQSVRQMIEASGHLDQAEAIRYGEQVAAALQYAHEQGVVHCDVKPENIMVTPQGIAKVADFGVAAQVTRTMTPDQARDILGTIAYLAPEVLQGQPSAPASDVYSLGLTVYEMAAGQLPFTGATPALVAAQRLANPAPPLEHDAGRGLAPARVGAFPCTRHSPRTTLPERHRLSRCPPGRGPIPVRRRGSGSTAWCWRRGRRCCGCRRRRSVSKR